MSTGLREFVAADYRKQSGAFISWPRRGYTLIDVLPFLYGRKWDDYALAYIHSLRPSSLRIATDGCTADSILWRVTVWLKGGKIVSIEQEVEVGMPEGVRGGGAALDQIVRPR